MSKTILLQLLLAGALATSGCAEGPVHYKPNDRIEGVQTRPLRVAVTFFESVTPPNDSMSGLLALPLYPYSTETDYRAPNFNHVETTTNGNTTTVTKTFKDFGGCLVDDLRASGLFTLVNLLSWRQMAASAGQYDLVISGELVRDEMKVGYTAYGLGFIGILLGNFLPLPAGKINHELRVKLRAFRPDAPLKDVWHKEFAASASGIYFFGNIGRSNAQTNMGEESADLLRDAFKDARDSLAKELEPGGKVALAMNGRSR